VETWQRSELTDVTAKVVIYEAFVEGKLETPKHLARTVHDLYFEPLCFAERNGLMRCVLLRGACLQHARPVGQSPADPGHTTVRTGPYPCDESRDAFHHSLTRALAANVDVAVVRVANINDRLRL
jgi:hypothetical protein